VLALIDAGQVTTALCWLMRRHGAAVYRYCREAVRDAALADDVHQQIFIEVFRDLPRFEGRSSVRSWLFAIARHRVLDASKMRRRAHAHVEPTDTAAADPPDPRPSPAEAIDEARLHEALVAGLAELAEPARTAVLLRYQQGFTFEEMADICHEKAGTLHARVARALRLLRVHVEQRLASPRRAFTAAAGSPACRGE
jgi:RNA polymerase sigma-70 factor (ECF subfamily)